MKKFNFIKTDISDLILIDTFYAGDVRGSFRKTYNEADFSDAIPNFTVKETMVTSSKTNVIRGLHFQFTRPQSKLVSCLDGTIYDVAVDLRPNSPTFGMWKGFTLSAENHRALYIPEGFAHGYSVIEPSIVLYQCGEIFYPEFDSGIRFDDPDINVDWVYDRRIPIITSEKDANLMSFAEYKERMNV